jgi:hypothetical protein
MKAATTPLLLLSIALFGSALNYIFAIQTKVVSLDYNSHYINYFDFIIPYRKRLVNSGEL